MDGLGDVGIGGGQGLQDPNIGDGSTKQQQQPPAPNPQQTVLPFVEPPIPRPSKYKEFGLPESKEELSIKVMEQASRRRREGSNRHIKGCERASEQLKFEIRAMNNRQRARAAELASVHYMESTSRALDEKEREIE
ncbi:hypothetical protein R1flu_028681 [Riccia fluitans]|uniref:BZIP domain-containing protein n=1 Tax=Riccia fluitans TaxID=41844 RepID=A0ABD1XRF8_9MARC